MSSFCSGSGSFRKSMTTSASAAVTKADFGTGRPCGWWPNWKFRCCLDGCPQFGMLRQHQWRPVPPSNRSRSQTTKVPGWAGADLQRDQPE